MAICADVPGIKVEVVVAGRVAQEWDPPNNYDGLEIVEQPPRALYDDEGRPHGYVVKRFGHHMAYAVEVDGCQLELDHEHDQEAKKGGADRGPWRGETAGYVTGRFGDPDNMLQNLFKFEDIVAVEEDQGPAEPSAEARTEEEKLANGCGKIRVLLWHMLRSVRMKRSEVPVSETIDSITSLNAKVIAEKGITHSTGYTTTKADMTKASAQPYWAQYHDPLFWHRHKYARPFAIFEFRYRSRDALAEQGVIPRPEVVERVESMDADQQRRQLMWYMEKERLEDQRHQRTRSDEVWDQGKVKKENKTPEEDAVRPLGQPSRSTIAA